METAELKNVGLKITGPRTKVLKVLENGPDRHLSAEDIYNYLLSTGDDIALATVYRVLTQFETAKLVTRHHFADGHSVFELNAGDHHDHIVCIKCGRVEEFFDPEIEARQEAIAQEKGYKITDHSLNIYGICAKCDQTG